MAYPAQSHQSSTPRDLAVLLTGPEEAYDPYRSQPGSRSAMRTGFTISASLSVPLVSARSLKPRRGQPGMRATGIGGVATTAREGLLQNRPANRTR